MVERAADLVMVVELPILIQLQASHMVVVVEVLLGLVLDLQV